MNSDLRLYDTMQREKRPLIPIEEGKLRMYVCGVTVYDLTHIGHARTFVTFDIITRYLRYLGYEITFVRNHTDIDDKIIKRANELNEDPLELAQRFIEALNEDMGELGVLKPTHEPKVSEHIDGIINMISKLIQNGHAYVVEGDVFFEVNTFKKYGKLSGHKLEELRPGERVNIDERKRNPADFALWKSVKPNEPSWKSPWGDGRPGWHIECSVMSTELLGGQIDIHGGGADLIFPHHENEIAQSEGANKKTFANYWMHVAMLNIDNEKMSKSLDNFFTVRDVLKLYRAQTIRYFFLTAHYRKPVNYSKNNLELARMRILYFHKTLLKIQTLWERIERPEPDQEMLQTLRTELAKGMNDDFNSPVALAAISEAAKQANDLVTTKKLARKQNLLRKIAAIELFFQDVHQIFGIFDQNPTQILHDIRTRQLQQLQIDEKEVLLLIEKRWLARKERNWKEADRIRDLLDSMKIELMDDAKGTNWSVKSEL